MRRTSACLVEVEDRRRARRHAGPTIASLKATLASGAEVDLINISASGALIETTESLSPGTSTTLRVKALDKLLLLKARILRSKIVSLKKGERKYQSAVQFEGDISFGDG